MSFEVLYQGETPHKPSNKLKVWTTKRPDIVRVSYGEIGEVTFWWSIRRVWEMKSDDDSEEASVLNSPAPKSQILIVPLPLLSVGSGNQSRLVGLISPCRPKTIRDARGFVTLDRRPGPGLIRRGVIVVQGDGIKYPSEKSRMIELMELVSWWWTRSRPSAMPSHCRAIHNRVSMSWAGSDFWSPSTCIDCTLSKGRSSGSPGLRKNLNLLKLGT